MILEVDPPDHTVTRSVLNRILSRKAMRTIRADFERFAVALVDELVERGTFDAVQDLAWRFPAKVLPDAVGITASGREHLALYSAMYFNNRIPGNRLADESAATASDAHSLDWVAMACSREHLAPGGFGEQIYAAVDAGEIDQDTATTLVRTFLGGGVDTTVLGLGSMLMLLANNPQQWDKLCGQPDLARATFDETLRLTPPAPMIGRTTTGPTELGGVSLGARDKLFLLVGAANRDPRRWDDPDQFDITRNAAGQLAFGLGPHFCVGHAVARLEAEVVLGVLIERVERIEISGEQVPELNNWLYGLRHLPLTVTPR